MAHNRARLRLQILRDGCDFFSALFQLQRANNPHALVDARLGKLAVATSLISSHINLFDVRARVQAVDEAAEIVAGAGEGLGGI